MRWNPTFRGGDEAVSARMQELHAMLTRLRTAAALSPAAFVSPDASDSDSENDDEPFAVSNS
jgi:hypothetical protein